MPKSVTLVRHGESLGQTASSRGIKRKDASLADCYLSPRGVRQARDDLPRLMSQIGEGLFDGSTDGGGGLLVCTSPLTRAVATAALGYGDIIAPDATSGWIPEPVTIAGSNDEEVNTRIPFVCHPALAEIGSSIPENAVRPATDVRRDLTRRFRHMNPSAVWAVEVMDASLMDGGSYGVDSESSPDLFLRWLLTRPEDRVIVVCHYNVIRKLLDLRVGNVANCVPIRCVLSDGGVLSMVTEQSAIVPVGSGTETQRAEGRNDQR